MVIGIEYERGKLEDFYNGFLEGQILVATPHVRDELFEHSVIYVFCHDEEEGALGIVINRPLRGISSDLILKELDITFDRDIYGRKFKTKNFSIYFGGPVDAKRGIILHSNDFTCDITNSNKITDTLRITQDIELLKTIAAGKGPSNNMVIFGYATWKQGQLEQEIKDNNWLHFPANNKLIFSKLNSQEKWELAAEMIGINDMSRYSTAVGHA